MFLGCHKSNLARKRKISLFGGVLLQNNAALRNCLTLCVILNVVLSQHEGFLRFCDAKYSEICSVQLGKIMNSL